MQTGIFQLKLTLGFFFVIFIAGLSHVVQALPSLPLTAVLLAFLEASTTFGNLKRCLEIVRPILVQKY